MAIESPLMLELCNLAHIREGKSREIETERDS